MNETLFIDSNIFIHLLYEGSKATQAEEVLERYTLLTTSMAVVDEVLHFIIRREALKHYSVRKAYDLRKLIHKRGIAFALDQINKYLSLLEELYIKILPDPEIPLRQLVDVMSTYKLTPKDAIIALTCRQYGISRIATFDEDFKRIPWLKVVP